MSARLGDAIGLSNAYRALWARDRHLLEEREKLLGEGSIAAFDDESLALLRLSYDVSSFVADQRLSPYLQIDTDAARDLFPAATRDALAAFGYFAPEADALKAGLDEGSLCHYGARYLPKSAMRGLAFKDVIDTGSRDGCSAKLFLDEYGTERVFCFEPDPARHASLMAATEAERASGRIVASHNALSDRSGLATLRSQEDGSSSASPKVLVETIPLDHFVKAQEDMRIGLIRIDVGGDAVAVLQGAVKTIHAHRPVLIVSIHHTPDEFAATPPFLVEEFPDHAFMIRKVTPHLFSGTVCIGVPRHH